MSKNCLCFTVWIRCLCSSVYTYSLLHRLVLFNLTDNCIKWVLLLFALHVPVSVIVCNQKCSILYLSMYTLCRSSYIQITIPCFCIKMICCFNDVHRLVNKMIVLLSEDLLIEFLLCHADVPSLQHLSFWSSKNLCKVNYEYVNALLYCTYAISYT